MGHRRDAAAAEIAGKRPSVGAALEAAVVVLCAAAGLAALWPLSPVGYWAYAVLAPVVALVMVVWIAVEDIRTLTIPDAPVVGLAIIGLCLHLAAFTGSGASLGEALAVLADPFLGLLFGGGCLLALREAYFRRRGIDAIGFGDVKLAAACGLLLGLTGFSYALLAASLAGLAFAGLRLRVDAQAPDRLPFGAFLAPICWCIFIILR